MLKKGAQTAGRLFHEAEGDEGDQDQEGQEHEHGIGETIAKGVRKAVGKVFHSVSDSDESQEEDDQKKQPEERARQTNGNGGHKPAKAGARR